MLPSKTGSLYRSVRRARRRSRANRTYPRERRRAAMESFAEGDAAPQPMPTAEGDLLLITDGDPRVLRELQAAMPSPDASPSPVAIPDPPSLSPLPPPCACLALCGGLGLGCALVTSSCTCTATLRCHLLRSCAEKCRHDSFPPRLASKRFEARSCLCIIEGL